MANIIAFDDVNLVEFGMIEAADHTCPRDLLFTRVCAFRHELLTAASHPDNRHRTARELYDEISVRYNPQVLARLQFGAIENVVRHRLRQQRPPVPASAIEMDQALVNEGRTIGGQTFFREVQTGDFGVNVLFASSNATPLLRSGATLQVDGTFRTVPQILGLQQLFTIMVVSRGVAVPVVQALMERRTIAAYAQVLRYVTRIAGMEAHEPDFIPGLVMSDYEQAIMTAVHEEWPTALIVGCYFHFVQALLRMSRTLAMTVALRENPAFLSLFRCLLALPLLPPNAIVRGFEAVWAEAQRLELDGLLEEFYHYVGETWIRGVGVNVISVYGQVHRTNNLTENYHLQLRVRFGIHPDFWTFIERLRRCEHTFAGTIQAINGGNLVNRQRRNRYVGQVANIRNATIRYENGAWTELEFLRYAGHYNANLILAANIVPVDRPEIEAVIAPPEVHGPIPRIDLEDAEANRRAEDRYPRRVGRRRRQLVEVVNPLVEEDADAPQDGPPDAPQDAPQDPNPNEAAIVGRGRGGRGARRGQRGRGARRGRGRGGRRGRIIRAQNDVRVYAGAGPPLDAENQANEADAANVPNNLPRQNEGGPILRDLRCIICLEAERELMFLPCRHFLTCERCNVALLGQVPAGEDQLCPTCREPVIDAVRVFVA